MDFSTSCSHCRRLMVDWEDKGLIYLLDMEHVMCSFGDGDGEEIVSIINCIDCPNASVVSEEEMSDEEMKDWIKWSIFGRFNYSEYAKEDADEQYSAESGQE